MRVSLFRFYESKRKTKRQRDKKTFQNIVNVIKITTHAQNYHIPNSTILWHLLAQERDEIYRQKVYDTVLMFEAHGIFTSIRLSFNRVWTLTVHNTLQQLPLYERFWLFPVWILNKWVDPQSTWYDHFAFFFLCKLEILRAPMEIITFIVFLVWNTDLIYRRFSRITLIILKADFWSAPLLCPIFKAQTCCFTRY